MSIYTTLKADAGVTAITTRIFKGEVPKDTALPLIRIWYVSGTPENDFDGTNDFERQVLSVHCFAASAKDSILLYRAARQALKTEYNIIAVRGWGVKDPTGESYQTQFDVSVWG
jgi:hypothetical protein